MPPKRDDLEDLLIQYKAAEASGDKAALRKIQNTVLEQNMNLVRKLVNKVAGKLDPHCAGYASLSDLYQAGCIGTMHAFKKWVPAQGKFSTYAGHWIRCEVQEAFGASQPMKRPRNVAKPWRVTNIQERIKSSTGREATAEEITEELKKLIPAGATEKQIKVKYTVTLQQLEDWRAAPLFTSFDNINPGEASSGRLQGYGTQARGSGGENARSDGDKTGVGGTANSRHELVPDQKPSPERQMENAEMAHLLASGLQALSDRELKVITGLFYDQRSYKELAEELGLCEERIRQLRESGLATLKLGMLQ